jgi:hypothetical protein
MKLGKWGLAGIALATVIGSFALAYAVNPWDTVRQTPGCSVEGCSACGGFNPNSNQNCAPKQRFCTWKCDDGTHGGCLQDDGC